MCQNSSIFFVLKTPAAISDIEKKESNAGRTNWDDVSDEAESQNYDALQTEQLLLRLRAEKVLLLQYFKISE